MKKKLLLFGILVCGLVSFRCEKDPISGDMEAKVKLNGVFIINEGGFGHNNGSLSFYSADDRSIQNNIFEQVNGRDLGDVVQSITIIDTLGFIVVNNSNTIEVISIKSWKSLKTIHMAAGSSPRYLADGENGKAYVTNLYANNVSVISLSNYQIETSVKVGANPEQIEIWDDKAFVANSGLGTGNTVSVIDLSSNAVAATITVGDNPVSVKKDQNNVIHVLCTGSWGDYTNPDDPGTNGGVFAINPVSLQVVDSLILEGHPSKLCIDNHNTGYFIDGSNIISFSTETYEVINDTLIAGFYYGLALDPVSEKLFAMDARDYAQNGSVSVFDLEGNLLAAFDVGIIPGSAAFVYEKN
ncbi:MAG: hypothetical protein P8X42_13290 [Calditrichaceae bacterium]|jgi:YVTN family beta-propeller protein